MVVFYRVTFVGVGKTTLVRAVCRALQRERVEMHGFYTEELRSADGRGPRVGFDVVTLDGRKAPLARVAGLVVKVGSSLHGRWSFWSEIRR